MAVAEQLSDAKYSYFLVPPPSVQEGWCLVLVKEKVNVVARVQLDLRSLQTAPINQPQVIDLTSKALIEK